MKYILPTTIINIFDVETEMVKDEITGRERVENLYSFFDQNQDIEFDYDYTLNTGLTTKDFIAPNSFDFTDKKTFKFKILY